MLSSATLMELIFAPLRRTGGSTGVYWVPMNRGGLGDNSARRNRSDRTCFEMEVANMLFKATQKPESTTAALRDLDDLPSYSEAVANLTKLRRQESELDAKLAAATSRMHEMCRGQAIPPRDHDREVHAINQRIVACKAEICEAGDAVRDAEGQHRIAISHAMKPAHDELRCRVIRALEELRDALDAEQRFRDDLDFTPSLIVPVRILDLDHDTLTAVIEGERGYL
jgi:hypothetical protein